MPLYEGIGLVGDKHAVVLDIGSKYTKCGYAGEVAPRFIIPSSIYDWKTNKTTAVVDYNRKRDEQFKILSDFLHKLYYKYLLVNPKDRRVVVVESVLSPTEYRDTLAKVFFQQYEVPSVIFVPCHLVSCFPLGTQNAVVVDVGHTETLVLPVFEGVPMLNACEAAPIGARAIERNIEQLLQTCKVSTSVGQVDVSEFPEILTENVLEDIKVRTCFVTHMDRGQLIQAVKQGALTEDKMPSPPPDVEYPLEGDKMLTVSGKIRESAMEVLFEPDIDDKCLPTLILDCLLRVPIDVRKPLAERILVVGGTAMVPGFMARLKAELLALLANGYPKLPLTSVKFFKAPSKENYAAWLGGAIFGSLEILPHRSISRESYLDNPFIPDWSTFLGSGDHSGSSNGESNR